MSDLYLNLLKIQLDRFHKIMEENLSEDELHVWAQYQVDKIMDVLTVAPEEGDVVEATINELLKKAPTGDAQ